MVKWFPMTNIWALKNLQGYQLWQLFEKTNFQGRKKLIFQSMSPNNGAIWEKNQQRALC